MKHTGSHPITETTCDDPTCWCNMKITIVRPSRSEMLKYLREYRANGNRTHRAFHLRTHSAWRAKKRKNRELRKNQKGRTANRPAPCD